MSTSSERYTETDSDSEYDGSVQSLDTTIRTDSDWFEEERKGCKTLASEDGSGYDMLDSASSTGLESISMPSSPSVWTLEEAKSSIGAFFADTQEYTLKQENKLRFWQALCIEFGLVDLGDDPIPPLSRLEVGNAPSEIESWSSNTIKSVMTAGQSTFDIIASFDNPSLSTGKKKKNKAKKRNLPPLPKTLTQAKKLLMRRAHVNLWDYMAARAPDMPDPKHDDEVVGSPHKNYAHLVWPSQKALVEYTLRTKKIVYLDQAKEEWLQPVLKDIERLQFKRGRFSTAGEGI